MLGSTKFSLGDGDTESGVDDGDGDATLGLWELLDVGQAAPEVTNAPLRSHVLVTFANDPALPLVQV